MVKGEVMLLLCKELVIFLIVAKMLEGLQSGKKYGKFIKLIISLIVVLKLISPIISVFDKDFNFKDVMENIENRLEITGEEVVNRTDVEMIEISDVDICVEEIWWEK